MSQAYFSFPEKLKLLNPRQIKTLIKSVFSVALPTKKHRQGEQSEPARRGEPPKFWLWQAAISARFQL
jgi:hypothetical protein